MKTTIHIKKKYLAYLLCILPFLEMPRIALYGSVNTVFLLWKMLASIYIIALTLINRKITAAGWTLIIYDILIFISTIINKGDVVESISRGLALLAPFLIVQYYIEYFSIKKISMPFIVCFLSYTFITCIQLIVIPFRIFRIHGLRDYYPELLKDVRGSLFILGDHKRFVYILLPMLVFVLLSNLPNYKTLSSRIAFGIAIIPAFFSVTYSWGVSAMLVLMAFVCLLVFLERKSWIKLIDKLNIWIIYIVVLVVNISLLYSPILNSLGWFFALFGKSTNLSGRTYIWNNTIEYIVKSPIWGYGINDEFTKDIIYGFVHAHNLLLDTIYKGGIILVAVFLLLNVLTGIKLYQNRELMQAKIITIGLTVFFVLSLTDTTDYNMLFLLYALGYSVDKLKLKNEKYEQRKFIGGD